MLSFNSGDMAGCLIDVSSGDIDLASAAKDLSRFALRDDFYTAKVNLAKKVSERFELSKVAAAYERIYCFN